jgi:hypothetical protein
MNGLPFVANMKIKTGGSLLLSEYAARVADTDVLDQKEIMPILHGLYGEVGGIMSTAKSLFVTNLLILDTRKLQRRNLAIRFGISQHFVGA